MDIPEFLTDFIEDFGIEVSALLLGQPLEMLDDLSDFNGQRHREIFGRVELFPVPFRGEFPELSDEFFHFNQVGGSQIS